MKKILIAASLNESKIPLLDIFEELSLRGHEFSYWLSGSIKEFSGKNRQAKKIYLGGDLRKKTNAMFFFTALPLLIIIYFFQVLAEKRKKGIDAIICFNLNEKTLFFPISKILGITNIWIELPESAYKSRTKKIFYRLAAGSVRIAAFNSLSKNNLQKIGIQEKSIYLVSPAIKLNLRERQENIFSELAQADGTSFRRKFFTVGTITKLGKEQNIEGLLGAVKICSEVIPNIQLIIVGEGEERKNLAWITKKMGIDSMVWFVGEQNHPRKWIDSFDILAVCSRNIKLNDMETVLKGMNAGIPVIGPSEKGLEDIVEDNSTGCLVESENSELLARKIIQLFQDGRYRTRLGQSAEKKVEEVFSLNMGVNKIEALFP